MIVDYADQDGKKSRVGPLDAHVGVRIKLRRRLMKLTQQDLGNALGLSFQQVQKYERGLNRVSSARLLDLSNVLDVPITFFFDDIPPVAANAKPSALSMPVLSNATWICGSHSARLPLPPVAHRTDPKPYCGTVVEGGRHYTKPMNEEHFALLRRHMIEKIVIHNDRMGGELGKAALDERVLAAIPKVPRHFFVPAPLAHLAYEDAPLPIGFNKTISQPFIAALMTGLLAPKPHETVLEIGTGLGYHAALLAELAGRVCSVEIVEEFASEAELRLRQIGYRGVKIRVGDGSRGWADHAPFDKIVVTAAANKPPPALFLQLKKGGRMVLPMGADETQVLTVIDKDSDGGMRVRESISVRFTHLETVT